MLKGVVITAVLVAATVVLGCQPKTRYEVLTFFFDGVPPFKEEGQQQKQDKQASNSAQQVKYTEHGPYAAKLCDGCHDRASNSLILPLEELCFRCHYLNLSKRRLHGPLGGGGCKVCHLPHGSRYRYLLVAEAKEFCLYCHDKKAVFSTEAHKDVNVQCTACHDAHSSDNYFFLK